MSAKRKKVSELKLVKNDLLILTEYRMNKCGKQFKSSDWKNKKSFRTKR